MTTIVRRHCENLAVGDNLILTGWDTPLRDDDNWYDSGSVSVSGSAWYRVTGSVIAQDNDITTSTTLFVAVCSQTNPDPNVDTIYRISDRRTVGTNAPRVTMSGLISAPVNSTTIGLCVNPGQAGKDWELELQVEAA